MFITNRLTPIELISELLDGRGYRAQETEEFRPLRHNNHLCPRFADNAKAALETYMSHHLDVHDVQGIRDEGIDVLLKYSTGGEQYKAGFQIKSYKEIEEWAVGKNKKFMENLKAQSSTALIKIRVDPYYIILCTDELHHQNQLRFIKSEFVGYAGVKIIEPRQALAFYKMTEIDVLCAATRFLCADDSVLTAALSEARDMPTDEAFVLIHILCEAFDGTSRVTDNTLFEMYSNWQESHPDKQDNLANVADSLERSDILQRDGEEFKVNIQNLPVSLCALYFDQKCRHNQKAYSADYLCKLLEIK